MPTRVLVVEDDPAIQELIRFTLQKAGLEPVAAESAEAAEAALRAELPDAVLIDWMLPKLSGLALAQKLRAEGRTAKLPLIMVTARGEEADRVAGLESGADDYLVKPFSPSELVARVKAILRRSARPGSPEGGIVRLGDKLSLDPGRHEARVHGRTVSLTSTEFSLLLILSRRPGWVFTREQILDSLWGDEKDVIDRTVDVHIRHLREKLGDAGSLIKNIRGVGYKIES